MGYADRTPAFAKWPCYVRTVDDIPAVFQRTDGSLIWQPDFENMTVIECPAQKDEDLYQNLLFAYGNGQMVFVHPGDKPVILDKKAVCEVTLETELLNSKIILKTGSWDQDQYVIGYVAAAHGMFDAFLRWLMDKPANFSLTRQEHLFPRPAKLKEESLSMFNYALPVYYLADGFDQYDYRSKVHRHHLFPWRKQLEEWLDVQLENSGFHVHLHGYRLTTCLVLDHK